MIARVMSSKEASFSGTVTKLFTRHPHHTKTDGVLSAAVLWLIIIGHSIPTLSTKFNPRYYVFLHICGGQLLTTLLALLLPSQFHPHPRLKFAVKKTTWMV